MRQERGERSVLPFEMGWNEPLNVTVSDEEFDVIDQFLPSLVRGCSWSIHFLVLPVCAFPPLCSQRMLSNEEMLQEAQWQMGTLCK